jgi:hypothetical protein
VRHLVGEAICHTSYTVLSSLSGYMLVAEGLNLTRLAARWVREPRPSRSLDLASSSFAAAVDAGLDEGWAVGDYLGPAAAGLRNDGR